MIQNVAQDMPTLILNILLILNCQNEKNEKGHFYFFLNYVHICIYFFLKMETYLNF